MARLILPVAGAAVGFLAGGPTGAQWGWMVGSMLGGLVPPRKRVSISDAASGQTTAEGAPRNIVYGTALCTGNIIDVGPLQKIETTTSAKGGGPSTTTTTYTRTYAIRIGEPIASVLMVKQDGAVVYDVREGADFADDNAAFLERCTIYLGDEDQEPDPDLEAIHGAGEVPAYRGTSYVVFVDDDLTSRGGSVSQFEFLVTGETTDEAVTETLSSVSAVPIVGFGGTGGILTGDRDSSTAYLSDPNAGSGTAYVTYFHFAPDRVVGSVQLYIKVGGVKTWTQTITLGTTPQTIRTQLRIVGHTATSLVVGFNNPIFWFGTIEAVIAGIPGATPWEAVDPTSPLPSSDGDFGVVFSGTDYRYAAYLARWGTASWTHYPVGNSDSIVLSDIVLDIHDRCGADVPDVSALTDRVAGMVLASADYTGADAVDALRTPYFFDRSEIDGELVYVKRGGASVATLTIDDLVAAPDETERQAQIEYPRKLHLNYQAPQVNYEGAQATSDRYSPDARVVGENSIAIPVVLDEDEATEIVSKLHKIAWADAEGDVRAPVPMDFIRFVPTDPFTLTLRDTSRRLRIERIEDAEGVRNLICKIDRGPAYSADVTAVPLPTPTPPVSRVPGPAVLAVLDMPSISDEWDSLGYGLAASGEKAGYSGALVQRSLDAGATWVDVTTISPASYIGELIDAVPTASEYYTDTTNKVRVQMRRTSQSMDSISDEAFLARGGAFVLEKPAGAGWEVMQYRDAVDEGSGIFELSVLHRGLLASGPSAHDAGATFVRLPPGGIAPAQSAWLGQNLTHRAVSLRTSPEDAAEQTVEFVGRSQIEWPVASLAAQWTGDTITASWAPRHRFGTDVSPIASRNFAGYQVTVSDGTVEQEFETQEESFELAGDAFASPVTVTVSALNVITGAGPAESVEVDQVGATSAGGALSRVFTFSGLFSTSDDFVVQVALQATTALITVTGAGKASLSDLATDLGAQLAAIFTWATVGVVGPVVTMTAAAPIYATHGETSVATFRVGAIGQAPLPVQAAVPGRSYVDLVTSSGAAAPDGGTAYASSGLGTITLWLTGTSYAAMAAVGLTPGGSWGNVVHVATWLVTGRPTNSREDTLRGLLDNINAALSPYAITASLTRYGAMARNAILITTDGDYEVSGSSIGAAHPSGYSPAHFPLEDAVPGFPSGAKQLSTVSLLPFAFPLVAGQAFTITLSGTPYTFTAAGGEANQAALVAGLEALIEAGALYAVTYNADLDLIEIERTAADTAFTVDAVYASWGGVLTIT